MTAQRPSIPRLASDRPRALDPAAWGHVERDGVAIWWEAFGDAAPERPTIFLLPLWGLVHSRAWNQLVPGLARHARVLVSDGPGSGRSGPARESGRHTPEAVAADCLVVMDAARVQSAVLVGHSLAAQWLLHLAAEHPDRVVGAVFIAPFVPVTPPHFPWLLTHPLLRRGFDAPVTGPGNWGRMNARSWRRDLPGFARWFARQAVSAPHSEGVVDEAVEYALDGDLESLIAGARAPLLRGRRAAGELADRIQCPVTAIHGDRDRITPRADAAWLAARTGGRLVDLPGADHTPQARQTMAVHDQILVAAGVSRMRPRAHAARRRRRVLFLSSPIGLGHARRDLAIARELRTLTGVEVTWLTQHPSTALLEREGETIHPASRRLASECRILEDVAQGPSLRVYHAFRRADAILAANYHVFRELVREEPFDLWVGDEAWELDHFLHEHPADKLAPYAWLTDYVGLLPTDADDDRERELIADRNALTLSQREREPGVRDASLFVGDQEDCVDLRFGPGLPRIDEWTRRHFEFTGYVYAAEPVDRAAVRAEFGWGEDERVCVAAVGGSAVGTWLLGRAIDAQPRLAGEGFRTVVVGGPRVDLAALPQRAGLEVHGYVHRLDRMLSAADVAIVQGGLATTMELAAVGIPFVFVPLADHFEQEIHVAHRLARHGAGHRLDPADCGPESLTAAVSAAMTGGPLRVPVPQDGARRAAQRIADLL